MYVEFIHSKPPHHLLHTITHTQDFFLCTNIEIHPVVDWMNRTMLSAQDILLILRCPILLSWMIKDQIIYNFQSLSWMKSYQITPESQKSLYNVMYEIFLKLKWIFMPPVSPQVINTTYIKVTTHFLHFPRMLTEKPIYTY